MRSTASSPKMLGMMDTRKIHCVPVHRHLEAAVLRHPAFGDVEFGHDLDAGYHLLRQFQPRQRPDRGQHPVDAVADAQAARRGLQMDIAHDAFSASYTVECTSLTTGLVSSLMVLNEGPRPRSRRWHRGRHSAAGHPWLAMFLVARQIRRHVGAMRQAPAESGSHALLGPGLQVAIERITHDQHQCIVLVAQGQTLALQRLGERSTSKAGPSGAVPPWPRRVMQRRRQRPHKALRIEAGLFLQHVDGGAPRLLCRAARRMHLCR